MREAVDVCWDSVDGARGVFGKRFSRRDSSPADARARGGCNAAGAAAAGSLGTRCARTLRIARTGRQLPSQMRTYFTDRSRRPVTSIVFPHPAAFTGERPIFENAANGLGA